MLAANAACPIQGAIPALVCLEVQESHVLHKCMSSRTGASTPKNSPLIMGRFCAYAIFNRSSMVFEHTILPSPDATTTPPQLQQHDAFRKATLVVSQVGSKACNLLCVASSAKLAAEV